MGNELHWQHILVEGGVYLIPTLAAFYLGYKKILWALGEYRLHRHVEREGPLNVDGIIYPQQNGEH